ASNHLCSRQGRNPALRRRSALAVVRGAAGGRLWRVGGPEGVAQGDRLDVARVGVLQDRRIDVEDDGHTLRLAGLQRLLSEAEALDFLEIFARLCRLNVEGGGAGDRLRA